MILALRSSNGLARSGVINYLESRGSAGLELEKTADYVKQSGALEKCAKMAQSFIDDAAGALDGVVPAENLKQFATESLKRVF
jgi:geranylgeranyl pyrophosphate synthase